MARSSSWDSLPTEAIHPESGELDRKSARAILDLLAREDLRVVEAVRAESRRIARAASLMARTLGEEGRVLLVGAGTSGRLAVLEAAECPPTFGTSPDRILALVAGGPRAVFRAVEGAEDREDEGARRVRAFRLRPRDLLIGISASSVTPFVRAALRVGRERGARTALLTSGPRPAGIADVVVSPKVGPEVLAGSTRLKAGTATKLVLNQITLLAMVRSNRIYGPFMVDLRPGSAKLRARALRMVETLAGVDAAKASELLKRSKGQVKTAIVMGRLGLRPGEARERLRSKKGSLRAVLSSGDAGGRAPRLRAPARR